MSPLYITLIVVASVIVVALAALLIGALCSVHFVLGRRKPKKHQPDGFSAERYGVDVGWFDTVAPNTTAFEFTAYDGVKIGARRIAQPTPCGRAAILCHGYGTSFRAVQPQAKLFYERGFDVYLMCMRGHFGSEGKVGMSWIDRFDVRRLVDRVIADCGNNVKIALFGVSMGGATVVSVAGSDIPPQVKCVVDDCGFCSTYRQYATRLSKKYFNNPVTPVPSMLKLALVPLSIGVRLVHGYNIADAEITPFAKKITVPALFIHGEKDTFVPYAFGKELFDAVPSQDKQFYSVPNAAHALCYATDPDAYAAALGEFLDKHMGGEG